MTNILKYVGVAIIGLVVGWLLAANSPSFGGVYTQVSNTFRQGINVGTTNQYQVSSTGAVTNSTSAKLGSSGTTLTNVNMGTCYIKPYATTIVASSSAIVDCQGTA